MDFYLFCGLFILSFMTFAAMMGYCALRLKGITDQDQVIFEDDPNG